MIVSHIAPEGWVDTGETGVIQPSGVVAMGHSVSLSAEDIELLRGPAGAAGADGADGAPGAKGDKGDKGDPGEPGVSSGSVAGMVSMFALAAAPSGWLLCNGAAVSRSVYAALFAAIGTTFGAGDGSTTFNLPELRGEFLRGLDSGRGVDVDRVLGSAQVDRNKAHNHGGTGSAGAHTHNLKRHLGEGIGVAIQVLGNMSSCIDSSAVYVGGDHVHTIASDGGTDARPRNVALLPCICTGA